MKRIATPSWNPDWTLTPAGQIAVTLSLSLSAHIPGWPGATDEQLGKVAEDVLARLRDANLPITPCDNS